MPRGYNQIDEAQLQGRLWTPTLVRPALWLDAADISTITIATGVSQWRDKSGNAKNVSQATIANQPALTTFNGLNAISFNGTSNFLRNTTTGITSGTYTGEFNVFSVVSRTTGSGGAILTERDTSLVGTHLWLGKFSPAYYLSSDGANNSSNHEISAASYALLSTSGGILSHQHVPAKRDNLWLNGSSISVITGTASNITGTAGFTIGARESMVGQFWAGNICEIIALTSNLTSANRQIIEGYLAWKWGLVSSLVSTHPYINRPPLIGD